MAKKKQGKTKLSVVNFETTEQIMNQNLIKTLKNWIKIAKKNKHTEAAIVMTGRQCSNYLWSSSYEYLRMLGTIELMKIVFARHHFADQF